MRKTNVRLRACRLSIKKESQNHHGGDKASADASASMYSSVSIFPTTRFPWNKQTLVEISRCVTKFKTTRKQVDHSFTSCSETLF